MKLLRAFLVLLVALDFFDPAHGLIDAQSAAAQANAPPIPLLRAPVDPGTAQGTFNLVIQEINNILVPNFPAPVGAVNFTNMVGSVTGQPVVIGLQAGGDANASIAIQPNGNGNVVLFGQGLAGQNSLARLQIGNASSWVKTAGLDACPGTGRANSQATALGVGPTVTGFFLMQDWLGRTHAIAGCG